MGASLLSLLPCPSVTLLLVISLWAASGEVELATRYDPRYVYLYNFSSEFVLGSDVSVATSMTINVSVVSETKRNVQQLAVGFSPLKLTWQTLEGIKEEQPFEASDTWFSVFRDDSGRIKTVQYSQSEAQTTLTIKKLVARMLSVENSTTSSTRSLPSNENEIALVQNFVEVQNSRKKHCMKTFTFERNGCLSSVILTENILHKDYLRGYNGLLDEIKSTSNLTLANKWSNLNPPTPPLDTINDSLLIISHQIASTTPLSSVYPDIMESLSCDPVSSICQQDLINSLRLLSNSDLKLLIKDIAKTSQSATVISLIDALALTEIDAVPDLLTDLFLSNSSTQNNGVVQRILYHFSTTLPANANTIKATKRIAIGKKVGKVTRKKAVLALGAMAKSLNNESLQLSRSIVQHLHDSLNKAPASKQAAVFIDSIGNAGDPSSQSILHHFARNDARVNVQHAAVRALRHHHDSTTASLLEELAETSTSSLVQHAAVSMYRKHPLAKRDLLETMKSRSERSRRNIVAHNPLTNSYNTTMPSIHWSTGFGDDNISIGLERTVHNHFNLQTDPFSTEYKLTMRDEAAFAADLHLSSGVQQNEFLRTELCLDGKISYTANMLTDYIFGGVRDQHEQFQSVVNGLQQKFRDAYNAIISSESAYSSTQSQFDTAITSVESDISQSLHYLSQFHASLALVSNGTDFKSDILNLSLTLNSSLNNIQQSFMSTKETIPVSLSQLLPQKLQDLFSVLTPAGQPFITSSLYLPYLPYAPQKALANIYEMYWNAERAMTQLQSGVNDIDELTSRLGSNREWTNPSLRLWSMSGDIEDIHELIQLRLRANDADGNNLRSLSNAITNFLEPALSSVLQAPNHLHNETRLLSEAFDSTSTGFDMLTAAYESTRSTLDAIFGQVVYPGFPTTLKLCDLQYGCGSYPSTTGGQYRNGIDLQGAQTIVAPYAGYVRLFNSTDLDNNTLYSYNSSNTIVLRPTEFSYKSYTFIISNVNPLSGISDSETFVKAGQALATAFVLLDEATIHLEAYKSVGADQYPQNPTQFIPNVQDPAVTMSWNCNEIATMIRGVVVDVTPVVTQVPSKQLIGDPLIDIEVPNHEFPQPYDLLLMENHTILSQKNTLFFESSTYLTVGPIPVTFSFTSLGHYETNVSFSAQFLSKQLQVGVVPKVWSSVNGTMKVGSATYALVEMKGTLIDTTVPLNIKQNFSTWPLVASSSMDFITGETSMNLTAKLVQVTGTGSLSDEQVLDYQVLWQYSIPYINRTEFDQTGHSADSTPPLFVSLPHRNSSTCYVQQIAGRKYTNPAFELEFAVRELESSVDTTYRVGTYENGANVIPMTRLHGERIVLAHPLVQNQRLFFTVSVTNGNGVETIAACQLSVYDSSPPLARVVPVATKTSHSNQFLVLLSLFDETGLESEQEVALGTVAGEKGSDLSSWQPLHVSSLNTAPIESGLGQFSFLRSGRLIENVLTALTDIDTAGDCADLCTSNLLCLSFDYSVAQKRCILHDNIVGPPSPIGGDFQNSFKTEPLLASHDFNHYERLGVGNSTLFTFYNLTLEHRHSFYVNLRLRNMLGYSNVISSVAVTVDLTPPTPGLIRNALSDTTVSDECGTVIGQICIGPMTPVNNHRIIIDGTGSATVFNGPFDLQNALYTKANTFLSGNWDGFHDRESGVITYSWCISSSSNFSCDIIPRNNPHDGQDQQYWSNTGLAKSDFADGPYYITVDAINGVRYGGSLVTTVHHSLPYIIDTTPPVINSWSIDNYDIAVNRLNVSFIVSDNGGSGINEIGVAVGATSDDVDILPWTVIATGVESGSGSVVVSIPDGINGWVKLQTIDNVGLRAVATMSTPINVDRSPPVIGTVYDGYSPLMDIDYQSDSSSICATWRGFSDPHSHITSYQWSVGSAPGSDDIVALQNLTDVEINERRVCKNVTLTQAVTYYSTLAVTNGADIALTVKGFSDGVTVDMTPPTTGEVIDGISTDIQFSSSLTMASFSWEGFTDSESSINYYRLKIYRTPHDSNVPILVHSETIQSTSRSYAGNHFSFHNGDFIQATVEAFNSAGLFVSVTSDGYLIDLTPPAVAYIVDGLDPLSDNIYQSSTDTLTASWSPVDAESAIAQVDIAFFRVFQGRKHRIYPDPAMGESSVVSLPISSTNTTVTGLELENGMKYILSLTLTNGAGLTAVYETSGVIIDSVLPEVTSVTVFGGINNELEYALVATSSMEVRAEWFGSDVGSGIMSYLVAIVTEDGDMVTQLMDFGMAQGGVIKGLNLTRGDPQTGPFYKVRVIAVDYANLSSSATDSSLFWVTTGDTAGTVNDGFMLQVDTDYTDEYYSVSASFQGFITQDCGGFNTYQWAVGVTDNRESVLPFTDKGVVLTSEGSGFAQIYLPDLERLDSQLLLVTVRGITDCGQTFESVSDGFYISVKPPAVSILQTGPFSIESLVLEESIISHNVYQSLSYFSSVWNVSDVVNRDETVRVKIGSYPGGSDVLNETETLYQYIRQEITTPDGIPNYVTVTATNRAGLEEMGISEPIIRDTSLPPNGEVQCSEFLKTPCAVAGTTSLQLSCNWKGTTDLESGIERYTLSIATDRLDQSRIYSREMKGNEYSFLSPVLNIQTGQEYYVTLYAENRAGLVNILTTGPKLCDFTPPVSAGSVKVVPNHASGVYDSGAVTNKYVNESESATCVWATDSLSLRFPPFIDEESSIIEYQLGIGTNRASDNIVKYSVISPTLMSASGLYWYQIDSLMFDSSSRGPLYFTIRAINNVSLYTDVSSDPVYFKSDANIRDSWVYDGSDPVIDIDFQNTSTYISGNFHYGVNCPLKNLQWAVEGADGVIAKNYTEIPVEGRYLRTDFSFSSDLIDLNDRDTYRLVIRGMDYADEVHIFRSNGTEVTLQQLQLGNVFDSSLLNGLEFQESLSSISFRISGFGDGSPEQRVLYYEAAIGSDSSSAITRSDIVPFTYIGLNTSVTFTNLQLVSQSQEYFVTVRAHSVSGSIAEVSSNGIIPGYSGAIISGAVTQSPFQSNTSVLSVQWDEFTSDVPMLSYEWAISGQHLNSSELQALCNDLTNDYSNQFVHGLENVQLSTFALAAKLNLQHNVSYFVVIRALDQAGKCRSVISAVPTLIDTTSPVGNHTIIGPRESYAGRDEYIAYVTRDQQLRLSWDQFTDWESPIDYYEVGLFELESCESFVSGAAVVDYVPVGLNTYYTFDSLNLDYNVTYVAKVSATNRAGLTSTVLSQPVMLDSYILTPGTVKDGTDWSNDAVFQNDLTSLSGVFSLAFNRPYSQGNYLDSPCPVNQFFTLNTPDSAWTNEPLPTIEGLLTSSLRYQTSQTNIESNGTAITATIDPTQQQIVSGMYSTSAVSSLEGGTVGITIRASSGDNELRPHMITSVIFIDSSNSDLLAEYDQPFQTSFKAVGLQIHHGYTDNSGLYHQQRLFLWSKNDSQLSQVQFVSHNVSLDLSEAHHYRFQFTSEQLGLTFRRKVDVYVDGILYATLIGIPSLTNDTRMILHMFNRQGYVPSCDAMCAADPPRAASLFSNISVKASTGSACDFGNPFFSWGSPVVSLEAAVGTEPGLTNVKEFEVISTPCIPCQPVKCYQYGCMPSCSFDKDPLTLAFTFSYDATNSSGSGSDAGSISENIGTLPDILQQGMYYLSVRAISASGQTVTSSSNGILIDVSPPVRLQDIKHYDVDFSTTQATVYQGNNHSISASWLFEDPESGVVEYLWAIGTSQFGDDIQKYTSVGLSNRVQNSSLNGLLIPDTVYYVTVIARNGAGLSKAFTSNGITYLVLQLNKTMLDLVTIVRHTDTISNIVLNRREQTVFVNNRVDSAGVEWFGVPPNISQVYWYIGSEPSQTDILPTTDVSFNDAHSASISDGVLYLDGVAFSNISETLALVDNVDPSSIEGFYFEPGRPFFHTLEFCTFAHNCEKTDSRAAVVIRDKDGQQRSESGGDIAITLKQNNPSRQNISILDKNYTLSVITSGGLQSNTILYTGFLSEVDVTRTYRVNTPYISNPYVTMDQTSRAIARRFVGIGGPSFFVSFLGQDNLEGELTLNVSFDVTLDWSETEPRLVYWDIDDSIWRDVENTCSTRPRVDFITGTVSVDVCSTALPESDTSNRPSALSRRRRATDGVSGDGMNMTQTEFLDRPTHFIVMQFGNFSLNTAPQLQLPSLVELNEDSTLTYTIPYTDNEGDPVWFYLTSVPRIGTASIDNSTGVLTYTPCRNCTGIENLGIYIVERELEFGTELSDSGILQLQVNNIDDVLDIFLFDLNNETLIASSDNVTVYVTANSTSPAIVARVATYDVDGYHDDLEVYVTQGSRGTSGYVTWLDAVSIPESLPVGWGSSPIGRFRGYVTFLGVSITYVPNSAEGKDTFSVYSQQEDNTFSRFLTVSVEIIPSWCVNGGSCNGSISDATCSDIEARKANPGSYTCLCPSGYTGDYCEISLTALNATTPVCPDNVPLFTCDGDPCVGASCPGYPDAVCVPDYCGHCHAVWFVGQEKVTCSAADPAVCYKPSTPALIPFCPPDGCSCPTQHYDCPEDSVFIETRTSDCCVTYSCECPSISCPHLMNCGHGVQPIPVYQGGKYPGRCCSEFSFEDINECENTDVNTCSDMCVNEQPFFSCACPSGKTLASDARTCGVCNYDGLQYLYGDTVKIGCNWCICQSDRLSGERWHCTANACTPGCYYNGVLYPANTQLSSVTSKSCNCQLTDKSAEWSCV